MRSRTVGQVAGIAATLVAAGVAAMLAQTPASVAVVGQVLDAVTRAPVGGAEVTLGSGGTGFSPLRRTVTTEDGRFFLENIAAGRYYLLASKPGFFQARLNDEEQSGPSGVLVVSASAVPVLTLTLRPHGAITGRVSDDKDKPVVGAEVTVFSKQRVWPSWGPQWDWERLTGPQPAVTSEAGHYIIAAVPPGDYLIQVDASAVKIPGSVSRTFGTTYSPGPPHTPSVPSLRLAMGERLVANVQLNARPAFDLTGLAVSPVEGAPAFIQLASIDDSLAEYRRLVNDQFADDRGSFSFTRLPPGDYLLVANVNQDFWAVQRLRILDRSLTDVHLRLVPNIVVSGRVVWEGAARPPERSTLLELNPTYRPSAEELARFAAEPISLASLTSVDQTRPAAPDYLGFNYQVHLEPDGTFTFSGPAGRLVALGGRANAWTMKSLRINGREAAGEPVVVESNTSDAVITMTRAVGEVQVTTLPPAGGPDKPCAVVLFPTNSRVWPGLYLTQRHHFYSDYSDDNGRVTLHRVLPGEYFLAAITPAQMESLDPELLARLATTATRIHVPADVPISFTLTRPR